MVSSFFTAVRSQDDVLDSSLAFPPQYAHQVFGEREAIFGYTNLKIKVMKCVNLNESLSRV